MSGIFLGTLSRATKLALVASLLSWSSGVWAITITTVPIGNPGNGNDPATGYAYGRVAYNYNIGKYDVTVGQYTAFLNSVAATDTYNLYNTSMATDLNIAGISRSGASGSYGYSVIGSPNHPITYVSWGDAARFSNWLNNGQPAGVEGPGTTETGAYTLNGAVSLPSSYRYSYNGDPAGDLLIGFRVATVPEPSTVVLAALGIGWAWLLRKRLR